MATDQDKRVPSLLCVASYEKGFRFLQQAKSLGCRVHLLTSESLREVAWPRESLDDIFYMPDVQNEWNLRHMLLSVAHLCRTVHFDRIVALDDFDLEKAALLREHLRIPGMGETATRFFRDKLAMRMEAAKAGIPVPEFTATINYQAITDFVDSVSAPWVLKPRLMAGAIGIKKCYERQEVWDHIHALRDEQSFYVLERFVPGDIFHVDSIWFNGQMLAAVSSGYGTPPLTVTQGGGIFTTQLLPRDSELDKSLRRLNESLLKAFRLDCGVSHSEFIRSQANSELLFLETSARVGGAHISELIEFGTGVNMWAEWAKIEVAGVLGHTYSPPPLRNESAGLLVSLARQEWPDTSDFTESELVWRLSKRHHVGFIVRASDHSRVGALLAQYEERVRKDYHASAPPREKVSE